MKSWSFVRGVGFVLPGQQLCGLAGVEYVSEDVERAWCVLCCGASFFRNSLLSELGASLLIFSLGRIGSSTDAGRTHAVVRAGRTRTFRG